MTRTPTKSVTAIAARASAWDVPGSAPLPGLPPGFAPLLSR
jgi:hypothetical protein